MLFLSIEVTDYLTYLNNYLPQDKGLSPSRLMFIKAEILNTTSMV